MRKYFLYALVLIGFSVGLSSCGSVAPSMDYKALAKASVKLRLDIAYEDNHKLYIESADWIGTPYRLGGDSKKGADCSGFTQQLYKKVYKVKLPRTTDTQLKASTKVVRHQLKEGDLVFFSSNRSGKKVAHVGIYLKAGKFIHASSSQGVIVSSLNETYYQKHWIRGGRIK
ncbi:C40 family peptidase [Bacteroides sp. 224]|uniref:C40 family peptidase n=1 Tax=Bacteroides sp. 224 TaxID=2302936 RepID=UPI0013D637C6|nr:NlpC/P60 family protein [Bacteroides sp. 224]NDV64938.1 NlpC/P60 family protein [Bacteroides sp. 224]